jgi:hypothetical protein
MKSDLSKQSARKKRLAQALRDNLKKRKAKERQIQPKEEKPGKQARD